MPLESGQTLLHYRLGDILGQGGMGTVYRAQDTKLGRDVALKFLPEDFATNVDRMSRFSREAQVLASLNHPNIAGIHSVEEAPNPGQQGAAHPLRFLVMELVEGETLQERIARGPLLLEEALQLALQIAVGLEEAHERGIIHRDLKPANLKLTPGNQIKILDFGLAKAFDPDPSTDSAPSGGTAHRMSLSPTMTAQASQAGMLLGTAAYMSPEQARGEPADRRADIWALGVVLMEMLTGKGIHRGRTISDTLASVLARDPEWEELPSDTPRPVRRLLERCLEKDNRQRLRDVGEARIAIEHFLEDPEADQVVSDAAVAAQAAPLWKRAIPWAVAGALGVALAATAFFLAPDPSPLQSAVRLSLMLPTDHELFSGYGAGTVLSPDGSRVAYALSAGNQTILQVHSLNQWEGTTLDQGAGPARPYQPFFSPDGQWIGFVTPVDLRKVPVSGGTPIKLCDLDRARGATWGPDGTIVFSPSPASPLMQLAHSGGQPMPLTSLDEDKGEKTHRWPQWLPGGHAVIFTSHTKMAGFDQASIEILIPATGERRVVHQGGTYGRYVATDENSGYVVYANADSLFAIPFDLERLEPTGSAAPVIQGVTGSTEGSAQFSVSDDGKLAYSTGRAGSAGHTVVWVDREGNTEPLLEEEHFYQNPAFSPDGTRLALNIRAEGQGDIWVYDIQRDVQTRLTFSDGTDSKPIWSPDGEYIYYTAEVDGRRGIHRQPSDGSGDPETLFMAEDDVTMTSISPDGKTLAFTQQIMAGNWDVGLFRVDQETEPEMLLTSPALEASGRFSPDGRWLAYTSNESGNFEVYVRPLEGRGKWQISPQGGSWSIWSRDGKELFFWSGTSLFVTDVEASGSTFKASRARLLFDGPFADPGIASPSDITPDGQRFVTFLNVGAGDADSHDHVQLVLNWFDELRATFGN